MSASETQPSQTQQQPLRVCFLGSGSLAVPVLAALLAAPEVEVLRLITQPDKPSGRKRQPQPTPLGVMAAERGIAIDKPASANAAAVVATLAELAPDVLVVVAYGQLIKSTLLELPRYGCMNVHASLLPRHRGASPINAAILHGDTHSGVCFMRMDKGLDTGPIYESHPLEIAATETAQTLERRLAALAAERIVGCLHRVCRDGMQAHPQATTGVTYAPKLTKHDGEIDWRQPATQLERHVRALYPWPGSYFWLPTETKPKRVQVVGARVGDQAPANCEAGTVLQADSHAWRVACGAATVLELLEVVPEGKRQMTAGAFLRGHAVPVQTRLCSFD